MGGDVADCVWTDPPYGVGYVGKTKEARTPVNDGGGADLLLRAMFEAARGVVLPGAPFYCAAPAGPRSLSFQQAILAASWRIHQELVWVKDSFVLGHSDYHHQHEPIYLASGVNMNEWPAGLTPRRQPGRVYSRKLTSAVSATAAVRPGPLWYRHEMLVIAITAAGSGMPQAVKSSVVWASPTRVTS
jgi:hypothetical protein